MGIPVTSRYRSILYGLGRSDVESAPRMDASGQQCSRKQGSLLPIMDSVAALVTALQLSLTAGDPHKMGPTNVPLWKGYRRLVAGGEAPKAPPSQPSQWLLGEGL